MSAHIVSKVWRLDLLLEEKLVLLKLAEHTDPDGACIVPPLEHIGAWCGISPIDVEVALHGFFKSKLFVADELTGALLGHGLVLRMNFAVLDAWATVSVEDRP